jgi:RNA polymerase sigma factor (sigma-70 family)
MIVFMYKVMEMINSDKLVEEFCRGDIEAHHFFFRLHADELYRFAASAIEDKEQGMRIVHEVIIKVWYRDNSGLHSPSDIKALFYRTLRLVCREHLRHKDHKNYIAYRKRIEDLTETNRSILSQEKFGEIKNTSQSEIDRARSILKLAFIRPMSDPDIAHQLSLTVGEVSHGLRIARQVIYTILE